MLKLKTRIAIKLPVPQWKLTEQWGDYHMGLALKREFERKGYEVILQTVGEWYNGEDEDCEVVIVLRGLTRYNTQNQHFNIMWNISHPDMVTTEEYNDYDHVFIASEIWADKIQEEVDVPVTALLQCTDPQIFHHEYDAKYENELLFVGIYREGNRKIINDLIPTDKKLAIYGSNWEKSSVDRKYIAGSHIPNKDLRKAYSSCKILLNDHWKDMRENGFVSNRLFDGFASRAFIISDAIKGVDNVFGDVLLTYEGSEELKNLVDHYLENEDERNEIALKGEKLVHKHHTYRNRVDSMLKVIESNITPKMHFKNSDLSGEVYLNRMWETILSPIVNNIPTKTMLDINSNQPELIKNILNYCEKVNCQLTLMNSPSNIDTILFSEEYDDYFVESDTSLINTLQLKHFDLIFVDCNEDLNLINDYLRIIDGEYKDDDFPTVILNNTKKHTDFDGNESVDSAKLDGHLNGSRNNLIDLIRGFVQNSDSDLSYSVTDAFEGLILVYPTDEAKMKIIDNTLNDVNLLKAVEEERKKFSVAYHESRILIDSLENKLIDTKIESENYGEETTSQLRRQENRLKQTEIKLENQIKVSNTLKNNLNEKETEIKKLEAEIKKLEAEIKYADGKDRPFIQKIISNFPSLFILTKMGKTGFKNSLINIKGYRSIKKQGLLDIGFYLMNNPDVESSGQDPIIHYLYSGFDEGRQPNPNFDCFKYLEQRKDVKNANINPLVHYSLYELNKKK